MKEFLGETGSQVGGHARQAGREKIWRATDRLVGDASAKFGLILVCRSSIDYLMIYLCSSLMVGVWDFEFFDYGCDVPGGAK